MLRNMLAAAMVCALSVMAALMMVLGGCAEERCPPGEGQGAVCLPASGGEPLIEIGAHPGRVARVVSPGVVEAMVFDSGGGGGKVGSVMLVPGAWLMPGQAVDEPAERWEGEGRSHAR